MRGRAGFARAQHLQDTSHLSVPSTTGAAADSDASIVADTEDELDPEGRDDSDDSEDTQSERDVYDPGLDEEEEEFEPRLPSHILSSPSPSAGDIIDLDQLLVMAPHEKEISGGERSWAPPPRDE